MKKLEISEEKPKEDQTLKNMKDSWRLLTIHKLTEACLEQLKQQGGYKMDHQKKGEMLGGKVKEGQMWKLETSEEKSNKYQIMKHMKGNWNHLTLKELTGKGLRQVKREE